MCFIMSEQNAQRFKSLDQHFRLGTMEQKNSAGRGSCLPLFLEEVMAQGFD